MKTGELTAEVLRDVLIYDAETGVFTWPKNSGSRSAGSVAGFRTAKGYWRVVVDGRFYLAHRLAWLYVYGKFPKGQIDHIDGDRLNNRIANLRDVTGAVNQQNQRRARVDNLSGFIGAHIHKPTGKYKAKIRMPGKGMLHLGYFNTAEEAHAAYVSAKRQLHEGCTL